MQTCCKCFNHATRSRFRLETAGCVISRFRLYLFGWWNNSLCGRLSGICCGLDSFWRDFPDHRYRLSGNHNLGEENELTLARGKGKRLTRCLASRFRGTCNLPAFARTFSMHYRLLTFICRLDQKTELEKMTKKPFDRRAVLSRVCDIITENYLRTQ